MLRVSLTITNTAQNNVVGSFLVRTSLIFSVFRTGDEITAHIFDILLELFLSPGCFVLNQLVATYQNCIDMFIQCKLWRVA